MIIKIILLVALASIAFLAFHYGNDKTHAIGFTELTFIDTTRVYEGKPRNVDVFIWYPIESTQQQTKKVHGIWQIIDAEKDAPLFPRDKKLPLVLFSHGYSGEPYGYSWFAEYLASHGYIVASVKHSGNTYGNMILEICARPWNRPQDLRFALDQLLANSSFKDAIDENRIGAAGFSQGGVTSLWLAGIQADLTQESVHKHTETINDDPAWKAVHEQFTQEDIQAANLSYKDDRIKAVFAMAPALDFDNWVFTSKEKIAQVKIPVEIVTGASDADVSIKENAEFFVANIPNSTLIILPGQVTHWPFLNESTPEGKKINPTITIDDPSINRGEIHKQVGAMALQFFNKYLNG
jgi:predicted dienelactone hydrolase